LERLAAADRDEVWRRVQDNMGLVYTLVNRYRRRGLEKEDLVQEGTIGLMSAALTFDAGLGSAFSTWAFAWVWQRLRRVYLRHRKHAHVIRETDFRRPDDGTLWDFVGEPDPPDARQMREGDSADLARLMKHLLSERYQLVLSMRYGLFGHEPWKLKDVAAQFGVTAQCISEIEARALEKLRKYGQCPAG
jgi:RNA polymerase sporulation-specific sigma factor